MSLIEDLDALEARACEMIDGADDAGKLEAARVALLGKKGEVTALMHMMGKVAPEERPVLGKRANELRRMVEGLIESRGEGIRREAMAAAIASTYGRPGELLSQGTIVSTIASFVIVPLLMLLM